MKTYYFKHPQGEILDAEENIASIYYWKKRFQYLGWSDGRFMNALRNRPIKLDKKGFPKELSQKDRKELLDAVDQEVAFAIANPDKTPPRSFDRTDLDNNPLTDPAVISAIPREP